MRRCASGTKVRFFHAGLTPPSSANSTHFQWQSTSAKPMARSQPSCVSTSRSLFDGASHLTSWPNTAKNCACRRGVGEETCSKIAKDAAGLDCSKRFFVCVRGLGGERRNQKRRHQNSPKSGSGWSRLCSYMGIRGLPEKRRRAHISMAGEKSKANPHACEERSNASASNLPLPQPKSRIREAV